MCCVSRMLMGVTVFPFPVSLQWAFWKKTVSFLRLLPSYFEVGRRRSSLHRFGCSGGKIGDELVTLSRVLERPRWELPGRYPVAGLPGRWAVPRFSLMSGWALRDELSSGWSAGLPGPGSELSVFPGAGCTRANRSGPELGSCEPRARRVRSSLFPS